MCRFATKSASHGKGEWDEIGRFDGLAARRKLGSIDSKQLSLIACRS